MPRNKPVLSRKTEAQRLLRLRQKFGLTQRELAQEFKSTPSAIALWETGDRTMSGPVLRLIEIYESGAVKPRQMVARASKESRVQSDKLRQNSDKGD